MKGFTSSQRNPSAEREHYAIRDAQFYGGGKFGQMPFSKACLRALRAHYKNRHVKIRFHTVDGKVIATARDIRGGTSGVSIPDYWPPSPRAAP